MADMRYKSARDAFFLLVVAGLFLIFSCQPSIGGSSPTDASPTTPPPDVNNLPASVTRVKLDNSGSGLVPLTGLSNNDLYLVRVNTSGSYKNANTTSLSSVGEDIVSGSENEGRTSAGTITIGGKTLTRYEQHWPVVIPSESQTMLTANQNAVASYAYASAGEDSTKLFYVDPDKTPVQQKSATLKKVGAHCKIWVADENFTSGSSDNKDNKVTLAQIETLADKFDAIYPFETKLLGYEYGGGGGGGVDYDSKIQILVYDIGGDFGDMSRTEMTLGYFYPRDEFKNATYSESNEAEIFYLDCETLDGAPGNIYTTLIHEFNHMINFNVKVLTAGNTQSWNTEVWYTEMLSMLAEDAIGPLVGIPYDSSSQNGHVILERIPDWLYNHPSYSVMQWGKGVGYYASNYAFGAYLVRNFGGPALLSHIAKSSKSGRDSLNESLAALNGQSVDVQYALARFGETMVYSGAKKPAGVYSFDKPASGTIDGTSYTFAGFDIWKMSYGAIGYGNFTGPRVLSRSETIPPYGVQIISSSDWKSKTGSFTVQIANGDNGVYNFVMVR
jgi:hypothetical protein